MFVSILLRDLARDFGVEFERLRHREIFKIRARADKKTIGSHLKVWAQDEMAQYLSSYAASITSISTGLHEIAWHTCTFRQCSLRSRTARHKYSITSSVG